MKSSFIKSLLTLLVVHLTINAQTQDLFKLPGKPPELIAPNFVNTDSVEINFVFNNSLNECFFMRIVKKSFLIFHSQKLKGKWTQPEVINLFSPDSIAHAIDMTITPDGKTMYFLGVNHKGVIENKPPDIYKSEKIDGIWQPASKVDDPISTDEFIESYPIVVSDGSIFFTSNRTGGYGGRDIYRAQYLGEGKFEEPLNLGAPINTSYNEGTTYVAPDESYLINTASKEDSKQGF